MSESRNSIADDILRNGFERWQRLEGEKQAISDDLKELFAELKGQGFDSKALRASFRMVSKAGDVAVEEHNALVDLYVGSLMGPRSDETGMDRATRSRAAREAETEDRVDALAALRADPAMAIVAPANLKKSEPRPTKAAGSDLAIPQALNGQVATHPEAKTSTDGGATEQAKEIPADSVTGEVSRASDGAGSVAPIQPEAANETMGGLPVAAASGTAEETGRQSEAANAAQPERPGVGVTGGESAATKYAAPGIVTYENHPPEGVERSAISIAFGNMGQDGALIQDDLANGRAQPIVKQGKVILDGWARFMTARNMTELDGSPLTYAVVQYDGIDPLIDVIRWNVDGRMLNEQQKRVIAQTLTRQHPKRKDDIYRAFELWMEPV